MARLDIKGISNLELSFEDLLDAPLDEMINAGTQVLVEEQKKQAQTMLRGKYYKGDVVKGLYAKKPEKTKDGRSQTITFKGKVKDARHKKGTQVGEIALINEYGKKGQPARPFIKTANRIAENETIKAEEAVYDKYLKSKGM